MDKIFWEKGYMNMHYPGGKTGSFQWEGDVSLSGGGLAPASFTLFGQREQNRQGCRVFFDRINM